MCCPLEFVQSSGPSTQNGFVFSPVSNGYTVGNVVVFNNNFNPINSYNPALDNRCGVVNASQTRVIGGRPTDRGQYPWIAALLYLGTDGALRQLCGGTLVRLSTPSGLFSKFELSLDYKTPHPNCSTLYQGQLAISKVGSL